MPIRRFAPPSHATTSPEVRLMTRNLNSVSASIPSAGTSPCQLGYVKFDSLMARVGSHSPSDAQLPLIASTLSPPIIGAETSTSTKTASRNNALTTRRLRTRKQSQREYPARNLCARGQTDLESEESQGICRPQRIVAAALAPHSGVLRDKFRHPGFQTVRRLCRIQRQGTEKGSQHQPRRHRPRHAGTQYHPTVRCAMCTTTQHRRVALKGDIPIGISRTSKDAWTDPGACSTWIARPEHRLMISRFSDRTGASRTYNWEEMARDCFAWWKASLPQDVGVL